MLGILVRLVVLVSFLIFVGWIVGGLYLDRVVKRGIERVGPEITGTPVSLDRAFISFPVGRGRLKGLVVENPEGFHTDRAFHLADSRIKFDPLSVFSGTLVIEEIRIESPEITYEVGFSKNNLDRIQGRAVAFARKYGLKDGKGADTDDETWSLIRVQINHVIVKNPKMNVSATLFRGRTLTFDLDDIHLRDIGKKSGGVTIARATSQVLAGTTDPVFQTVSRSGEVLDKRAKRAKTASQSETTTTAQQGDSAFGGIADAVKKAWKAVLNAFDSAAKVLKNLFGK